MSAGVTCQVCGFETSSHLQSHLLYKHGLKCKEYEFRFPGFSWCSIEFKDRTAKVRAINARTEKSLEAKSKNGKSNLGKRRSEEYKESRSIANSGEKNPFYGRKHSLETKIKLSCYFRGLTEEDFDGFSKPLARREVGSGSFRFWRRKVFERDNYTCLLCDKRGGELEPHHILPRRDHKDLIYKIENGATLCVSCHHKTFSREYEFVDILTDKVQGRILPL